MNCVKVKQDKHCTQRGVVQFSKHYPQSLYGVLEPNEFEQLITRINTECFHHYPKTVYYLIGGIVLFMLFIIIGFSRGVGGLVGVGFAGFICVVIAMIVINVKHYKKVKASIEKSLFDANNYYSERRITLHLKEKHPDPHKQIKHGKKKFVKLYIDISFPAPSGFVIPMGMPMAQPVIGMPMSQPVVNMFGTQQQMQQQYPPQQQQQYIPQQQQFVQQQQYPPQQQQQYVPQPQQPTQNKSLME
ncbi:hypothetical protein DLAC_02475 [Tieghemostelium lacteum]|uniref:Uncharacterized protein n=1 Tax=Tieghemostelium lacteum TaxID=361077 RepID=A0A152A2J0_TIELA|nr:hypothetical protein DLAC_02475 [Tieghemostelium lacteum]|eukprot:KYR00472.1 hypothetical protein DLAC_02475 [Tieghemostelium lacteum]